MTPQPYVTSDEIARISRQSSAGTAMKWNGDGPRQYVISPLNSSCIKDQWQRTLSTAVTRRSDGRGEGAERARERAHAAGA